MDLGWVLPLYIICACVCNLCKYLSHVLRFEAVHSRFTLARFLVRKFARTWAGAGSKRFSCIPDFCENAHMNNLHSEQYNLLVSGLINEARYYTLTFCLYTDTLIFKQCFFIFMSYYVIFQTSVEQTITKPFKTALSSTKQCSDSTVDSTRVFFWL